MTVDWDRENRIDHQNSPKRQEWKWKKEIGKEKFWQNQNRLKTNTWDKLKEQDKSTIPVDSTEGTNKQIPRQSQSRRKNQGRDRSTSIDWSTMTVDLSEEADRNFPPKPKESLLTHASANYRIEGMMGHASLSPPINTEDLEWD